MTDKRIKKIGLVGGTGPESTLMYYKELNSRIDKLTDGKAMPDIAIESVNFRRAWTHSTITIVSVADIQLSRIFTTYCLLTDEGGDGDIYEIKKI